MADLTEPDGIAGGMRDAAARRMPPGIRRDPAMRPVSGHTRSDTVRRHGLMASLYITVLALLAVPIFSVVVPPLNDYPNHLARMHILAAYGDSPELRADYVIAWKLAPYLAMDLIIPRLAHFMSIYTAGRVFLYLCLVQFVLGTAAVHLALHRKLSPWPAASGLVAYSFIVSYGFVNYMFGIGVWLLAFAGWIVLSRNTKGWRIIGGPILSLVVFFSHFFAFFGYMLCVGGYEPGVWILSRDRKLTELLNRGAVAFSAFIVPLIIFAVASRGGEGGATLYATPFGWIIAMVSPLLFPGGPPNIAVLTLVLLIPAWRAVLRRLRLAPAMWMPIAALSAASLAVPGKLLGVWGVDYRLPIVIVFLLIASCSWRNVPKWAEASLAGCMVALLAVNVSLIAWEWQPVARQFDAFRAALTIIPRGARVIAFYDDDATGSPSTPELPARFDHLPTLAIIERGAFVPFLFQNKMMPVQAAPDLRALTTPVGRPVGVVKFIQGADPVKGPRMLGTLSDGEMHDYWGDWPRHYDYAVELGFGAVAKMPPQSNW